MEKTRLAQALDPLVAHSHWAVIKALESACAIIGATLDRRIGVEPSLARKRAILTSIPRHRPAHRHRADHRHARTRAA